jgi:hypothetical protein
MKMFYDIFKKNYGFLFLLLYLQIFSYDNIHDLRLLIPPFVSSNIFLRQHTRYTASYSSFCIFKYFHTTAYTIYGFLIFLWYLQIFSYDIIYDLRLLIPPLVSSDIFIRHHTRFTASYFSFGIFKLFLHKHIS